MKTIAKENIKRMLKTWADEYNVIAPKKTMQGDCIFDSFQEDTFTLDYTKPPLPPKSSLFPHVEVIFQVENHEFREVVLAHNTILFGIRSCDMMGLLQCASFMTRDREDIYYSAKRERAITVVMACPGPQNETCFCTTTQSGPVAQKGFDILLYDMGDVFIIETGSQRGQELLLPDLIGDMDDAIAGEKIAAFTQKAVQEIPIVHEVTEAMNRLKDGSSDEKVWEYFGRKCIVCGGCTFVCPTCTCFNVYDHERAPGRGIRARTWDACLYGGFTREASGHNPRSTQALRLKRRHEHKLLYYNETDIQGSLSGCVGCGRCSDYCPVHIGALEVVKEIAAK
jgi:formate hydrogenlyase subunit 6/NADH:ubiquinone oxidoreductase subunit I